VKPLRGAALALFFALGPAAAALGQSPAPDVPAGTARLSGRVLLAGENTPVPGVEVALYALTRDGIPGLRRGESDASGEFVFEVPLRHDVHRLDVIVVGHRALDLDRERHGVAVLRDLGQVDRDPPLVCGAAIENRLHPRLHRRQIGRRPASGQGDRGHRKRASRDKNLATAETTHRRSGHPALQYI
jgi:hypothetical protein